MKKKKKEEDIYRQVHICMNGEWSAQKSFNTSFYLNPFPYKNGCSPKTKSRENKYIPVFDVYNFDLIYYISLSACWQSCF